MIYPSTLFIMCELYKLVNIYYVDFDRISITINEDQGKNAFQESIQNIKTA